MVKAPNLERFSNTYITPAWKRLDADTGEYTFTFNDAFDIDNAARIAFFKDAFLEQKHISFALRILDYGWKGCETHIDVPVKLIIEGSKTPIECASTTSVKEQCGALEAENSQGKSFMGFSITGGYLEMMLAAEKRGISALKKHYESLGINLDTLAKSSIESLLNATEDIDGTLENSPGYMDGLLLES